jgi:hypothetical protein
MRNLACLLILSFAAACGSSAKLDREALLNPDNCQSCHPEHYNEWSGSMHAYAGNDPIFLAMNRRGQRETGGALGDFCIKCHAPMALQEGLTTDGLNLETVPQHLKGVTCYFCHNVVAVQGTHNNPLVLANDDVMRGSISDVAETVGHKAEYSALFNRGLSESSGLCGSCHDVVTPNGFHLERGFKEWKESLFSHETQAELQTCGRCHMPGRDGLAAQVAGAVPRRIHSHAMPGVDLAVIDWPQKEAQRALVQADLDSTLISQLCITRVQGGIEIRVDLENFGAGHNFPSSATHNRRAWVEVRATQGGRTIFETGVVSEGTPVVDVEAQDPQFWRMGEYAWDADGETAHMFWEIVTSSSSALPAPTALGPWDPDYIDPHVVRTYRVNSVADRVEMKVHIRPMGLDIVDDLIASGDLDPKFRDRFETHTLASTVVVWTPDTPDRDQDGCVPDLR